MDSKGKAWTTPVVCALSRADERVRRAADMNPDFAAALRPQQDADREATPLAV